MIKIENVEVVGFEHALRGMRNPMNSWNKSDSDFHAGYNHCQIKVGENDLKLANQLSKAGTDHSKYLRMITVYMDITAPLYFWKQTDQYKIGVTTNSTSTMHCIHKSPFLLSDFSVEHLNGYKNEVRQERNKIDEDTEQWQVYPNNNDYVVSNQGRVKRLKIKTTHNRVWNERILTNTLTKDNYLKVGVKINGKQKDYRVHRMVAETWIENLENKPEVNHIDGNKLNNSVENLEWCTSSENTKHSYETKLQATPINSYLGKLSDDERLDIVLSYNSQEMSKKELSEKYKVSKTTINSIINNKYSYCKKNNDFEVFKGIIEKLNESRELFIETNDKKYWWQMIQLLPSSYNQKRTVMLNYQVLKNIYHARKSHKLNEWREFCEEIEKLPYFLELTQGITTEK